MFEIWSRGIDSEIRSIYWTWGGVAQRLNGHYIAKHFTNNVLDSQYITSTSQNVIGGEISASLYGGITKMAFRKGNKVILWVMNLTSSNLTTVDYPSFTIDLLNSEIDGNVEHKYWVSGTVGAANIEGIDATITPASNTSFSTSIDENSIHVFTFNVEDNGLSVDAPEVTDVGFKLYPNPVGSILTIQGVENSTIRLYDINGRTLLTKVILNDKEKIDISHLESGLYYLKTDLGTKSIIKK